MLGERQGHWADGEKPHAASPHERKACPVRVAENRLSDRSVRTPAMRMPHGAGPAAVPDGLSPRAADALKKPAQGSAVPPFLRIFAVGNACRPTTAPAS